MPATVEGWDETGVRRAEDEGRRKPIDARALVSPFDPIMWNRIPTAAHLRLRLQDRDLRPGPKADLRVLLLPFLLGRPLRRPASISRPTGRVDPARPGAFAENGTTSSGGGRARRRAPLDGVLARARADRRSGARAISRRPLHRALVDKAAQAKVHAWRRVTITAPTSRARSTGKTAGSVRVDRVTRELYSTDASPYRHPARRRAASRAHRRPPRRRRGVPRARHLDHAARRGDVVHRSMRR